MTTQTTTLTYLDSYCERQQADYLWAEPFNVITNVAFLIAAILLWRLLPRRAPSQSFFAHADIKLLIVCIALISIGSGLWHLYATNRFLLADVVPIVLFINIYLMVFMRRSLHLTWVTTIVLWLLFQVTTVASESFIPRDLLHGTIMYLPTYVAVLIMASALQWRGDKNAPTLWLITFLWSISLVSRTIDIPLCGITHIGTHFIWHILNAMVLYLLTRVQIKSLIDNSR